MRDGIALLIDRSQPQPGAGVELNLDRRGIGSVFDRNAFRRETLSDDRYMSLAGSKVWQHKRAVIGGRCLWIGFAVEHAKPHLRAAHRQLSFVSNDSAQSWPTAENKNSSAGGKVQSGRAH